METENAVKFFHACESGQGWSACSAHVVGDGVFSSQSKSLEGVVTIKDYCDGLADITASTFRGASYELHDTLTGPDGKVAFFGTSIVQHVGEGGPVPPTHRQARAQFVYIVTLAADGKVSEMTKVFDTDAARRELGWPPL